MIFLFKLSFPLVLVTKWKKKRQFSVPIFLRRYFEHSKQEVGGRIIRSVVYKVPDIIDKIRIFMFAVYVSFVGRAFVLWEKKKIVVKTCCCYVIISHNFIFPFSILFILWANISWWKNKKFLKQIVNNLKVSLPESPTAFALYFHQIFNASSLTVASYTHLQHALR